MAFTTRTRQPGTSQHMAEQCKDESCPRLPCRMWKAGYRKGYDDGWNDGYMAGEAAGFAAGFAAGMSAGAGSG